MTPELGQDACQACGATLAPEGCRTCQQRDSNSLAQTYLLMPLVYGTVALAAMAIASGVGSVQTVAPIAATLAILTLPARELLRPLFARMRGTLRLARRIRRAARSQPTRPAIALQGASEIAFDGRAEIVGSVRAPRIRVQGPTSAVIVDGDAAVLRRVGRMGLPGERVATSPAGLRVRVVGVPRWYTGAALDGAGSGYRDAEDIVELGGADGQGPIVLVEREGALPRA